MMKSNGDSNTLSDLAALTAGAGLRPSPRLPVLFLGHGSPMNAIEDNRWQRGWRALGAAFGAGGDYPLPQLIVCISAHWLTRGWWLTAMASPRTLHDFGGFPPELFAVQYPAPGAPSAAAAIAQGIRAPGGVAIGLDHDAWGLDHGAWSVLRPMFPDARVPVIQLSLDYARPPAEHFALGRALAPLRDFGVLIVGSGNEVHNLRAMRWQAGDDEAFDWARAFDQRVARHIEAGELAALADFASWGPMATQAHPTHEHLLPLLHAAGAASADANARAECFNVGFQGATIGMRSVVWR